MDKLKLEPFGEVTNYLQLMEQAPKIFERIVRLEVTINKLIEILDSYAQSQSAKKEIKSPDAESNHGARPAGALVSQSPIGGKVPVGNGSVANLKGSSDTKLEKK